jgi:hypothetical protein
MMNSTSGTLAMFSRSDTFARYRPQPCAVSPVNCRYLQPATPDKDICKLGIAAAAVATRPPVPRERAAVNGQASGQEVQREHSGTKVQPQRVR